MPTITMNDLNLIPGLADAVADMGYTHPTPIQAKAIPVALAGQDLIGCAATGTGKTAAFVLPILQRLRVGEQNGCRALILCPTRELALQIDEQVLALGYHLGLSAVAVVGGMAMDPQERALRGGSNIVVATPGRLLDHMRGGYVELRGLEILVLDEADRMLDMGFLPDIQRILSALPTSRQTLMFSATMSSRIHQLASDILRDPVFVRVDPQKPVAGLVESACAVPHRRKAALLSELLRRDDMRSVLVFVRRKADADRVARAVTRGGVKATSIHSDRGQPERLAALEAFRRGECPVLVATDVAARGLDVEGISHVINFDVPYSPEDYIHRAGRTARAGAGGAVITFVSPEEESHLGAIEKVLGASVPRALVHGFATGAPDSPGETVDDGARRRHGGRRAKMPAAPRRSRQRPAGETAALVERSGNAEVCRTGTRRRHRRRSRSAVAHSLSANGT